ncbi:MAG: DUF1573 domain-containing protein [Muribaculaceae bacterium]|nr:DUF1573 domain-containing protein [Muribaculaceae bacterium]
MRYLLLLPLTILLALSACKSDKDRMAEIVEEWQGREIVFPEVMTDFQTGDTIDLSDADFTIFTYMDSVGCTACKMKLPVWREFLNSLDSIANSDVRFIMIADRTDVGELSYLTKRYGFEYPIYVDAGHRMSNTYSFPDKVALQTFLLDKDRKVMSIGSPVYSSDIDRMYKAIISGKMAFSSDADALVTVEPNRINLGKLRPRESASLSVIFNNSGADTVHIRKIVSSCDCTGLSIPGDALPPESKMEATLAFSGDTVPGEFERTVHVCFEAFDYPLVINVFGNIIQ